MLIMIAAMTKDKGIGYQGAMPWHLPEELAFFKEQTLFHKIVMGSKTYESLKRPLPLRINIVLSSKHNPYDTEVVWMSDIKRVMALAKDQPLYITGGSQIYEAFLPYADKLILSVVEGDYKTDCYFPNFNEADYSKKMIKKTNEFTVYEYERK